jgi:hypothetical protein
MRRRQIDLALAAAVPAAYLVTAMLRAPVAVTVVLGIALAISPGYVWAEIFAGTRLVGLERVAVATGLSLALPVLGGLALNAARIPLQRSTWAWLLTGVTLVGDAVLFTLRRTGRRRPARQRQGPPRPGPRHLVAFGVAALIAASAVGLSLASAARQAYPGFTQLWLSTPSRDVRTVALGVENDQGSTTHYRLVLLRAGHVSATWNLTLSDGQTWRRTVPVAGGYSVAARLYRLPDLSQPYRYVTTGDPPRAP